MRHNGNHHLLVTALLCSVHRLESLEASKPFVRQEITMTETIIRGYHDRDNPYFMMCRATAQNRKLSWEARGMLSYFLSKPNDWKVDIDDLKQECGRDKVYAILRELIQARYMTREDKIRIVETQRFSDVIYTVYETPLPEKPEADQAEEPLPGFPYTAKPEAIHNTEEQSTEGKAQNTETDIAARNCAAQADDAPVSSPSISSVLEDEDQRKEEEVTESSKTESIQEEVDFSKNESVAGKESNSAPIASSVYNFSKPNPYRMGTREWGEWNTARTRQQYDRRLEMARKRQDRERGPAIDEDGNELATPSNPRSPAEVWFIKWLKEAGYNVSPHGLNADARRKFEQRVAIQLQPKPKYRPSIPELWAAEGPIFEEWLGDVLNRQKTALNGKKVKVNNFIAHIHNQYLTYDEFRRNNNTEWWNDKPIEEKESAS